MINDIIIIKDGIPLLSRNFSNSGQLFLKPDNLIMVSGFFSALNSFSDQFDDLGSISELKFDSKNNKLKLSFLKDKSIPNMIYLASFDEKSKGVNVQRYLRKISNTFLKKYNIEQITKWSGRADTFKSFEEIIKQYVDDEKKETEVKFKEKVVNLFNIVKEKIDEDITIPEVKNSPDLINEKNTEKKVPEFYNFIPIFKVLKKINPKYYLTGEISQKIYNYIDGKRPIIKIAEELNITPENVHNVCKNLVKLGFISIA
ncbi:MAG: hypothetical protein ACFFAH_06620 [Promethearchaeota archaeon]